MSNKVRELISDRLIEEVESALKKGEKLPWQKPWQGGELVNMASKHKFTGGANILMLMLSGEGENRFATAKQIKAAGGTLEKGAKAIPLLMPLLVPSKDDKGNKITKDGKPVLKCIGWRYYKVFSAKYIKGGKFPEIESEGKGCEFEPIEALQKVVDLHELPLEHRGGRACYSPSLDKILMPEKERFESPLSYYKTLLHEMGHWSAKRVGQDIEAGEIEESGSKAKYGFEELRAEITSCMTLSACGIDIETEENKDSFRNSVAYLQNWLKQLKNNPNWLLKAAQDADKRAAYLLKGEDKAEGEAAA